MKTITRPMAATSALLLAILASGCAAEAPASDPGAGSDQGGDQTAALGDLAGRTFYSTDVTQTGSHVVLANGTRISIQFADSSLSANAGCNTMGGDAAYTDHTLVVANGLSMTEMGCDQARMDQDTWLVDILTKTPGLTLDDDNLTLTSGDTVMTFLDKEIAEPDLPLAGTSWILDSIGGGGGEGTVSSVPSEVTSTLAITDNGRLFVDPGCNSGSAPVEVADGTMSIGPVTLTLKLCTGADGDVEHSVLAVLEGEVDYLIDGSVLTLTNSDRSLTYRTAPTR